MEDIYDISEKNIQNLEITSKYFDDSEHIPAIFTCDWGNNFPSLMVSQIPSEVQTLALIVDDPDAPNKTFVHLVAWNIPFAWDEAIIDEDILTQSKIWKNDFFNKRWGWPCPPMWHWIHQYYFKVYWLDTDMELLDNSTKEDFLKTIDLNNNLVAYWELIWEYER